MHIWILITVNGANIISFWHLKKGTNSFQVYCCYYIQTQYIHRLLFFFVNAWPSLKFYFFCWSLYPTHVPQTFIWWDFKSIHSFITHYIRISIKVKFVWSHYVIETSKWIPGAKNAKRSLSPKKCESRGRESNENTFVSSSNSHNRVIS